MDNEKKRNLASAGGLAGGALLLLGLYGYVTDAQGLVNLGRAISQTVPVWVLLLVGFILMLLSWGPGGLRRLREHGHKLTRAEQADLLEKQLAELQTKWEVDQKTITALRDLLTDARKERDQNQLALDEANAEIGKLDALLNYGDLFLKHEDLKAPELTLVVSRVWELVPAWKRTVEATETVWRVFGEIGKVNGGPSAWLWQLLDERDHGRTRRSLQALEAALNAKQDPRPYLGRLYTTYRKWRRDTARIAEFHNVQLTETFGYQQWQEAEQQLWRELQPKLALPELWLVKRVMRDFDEANGTIEAKPL